MKTVLNVTLAVLLAVFLVGCGNNSASIFQGYVEGEYVYVAAPLGGALAELAVARGGAVTNGQILFTLERQSQAAALEQARHQLAQSQAQLEDLTKGKRPTEIAALEAQLVSAKADLRLAQAELERREKLGGSDVVSREELDKARAGREAAEAQVNRLAADLETARLGAREDAIGAAQATVAAQQAALEKAKWAFDQKQQFAPANAAVHDTLYRQGEFVAAGNPVVSLLPPENLKVRFFVPQERLPQIKIGQTVSVHCDGAGKAFKATINYISTQAEYTPPVIYSRETRASLVYMIEAKISLADAANARPGQPVDVTLN